MQRAIQQQTVAINRGLFLVRYATAEDEARPPKVTVAPDHASTKHISFLLHPDHEEAVLWQPDSSLVVRAMTAGKLSVQVVPTQEGGSAAATVKIEPLNQGDAASPLIPTKKRNGSRSGLSNIRVLGHVAAIGDVLVNANQWIAGPSAPSRIEGLCIDWPGKPPNLEIHYMVKTAQSQTTFAPKMGLGSFSGTRGKAMPIVAVMLELSGPDAKNFQFSLEAIFLGSPAMRVIGRRVVASGPTGREPLVGLRLGVEKIDPLAQPQKKSATRKPTRSESRVRVFRSHTKQPQAAV